MHFGVKHTQRRHIKPLTITLQPRIRELSTHEARVHCLPPTRGARRRRARRQPSRAHLAKNRCLCLSKDTHACQPSDQASCRHLECMGSDDHNILPLLLDRCVRSAMHIPGRASRCTCAKCGGVRSLLRPEVAWSAALAIRTSHASHRPTPTLGLLAVQSVSLSRRAAHAMRGLINSWSSARYQRCA